MGDRSGISYGLKQDVHSIRRHHNLTGYTIVITGASRGIGLAIALAAARQGANIAIWAKSTTEDPRLPGTIYTAKREVERVGGLAEAIECDIRSEEAVDAAVARTVARFGGIDIVVNNASAISLTPIQDTTMKKFDLMHAVDARGTFLTIKKCLPYLKASASVHGRFPHILTLSPPLEMASKWFAGHVAYAIAKFGMSMCTLGLADELADDRIACNSLWPRTSIATAAVNNLLGGEASMRASRIPDIMGDAAVQILQSGPDCTGNFFLDEAVLRHVGVVDFSRYRASPTTRESDLLEDLFVPASYTAKL